MRLLASQQSRNMHKVARFTRFTTCMSNMHTNNCTFPKLPPFGSMLQYNPVNQWLSPGYEANQDEETVRHIIVQEGLKYI
jgi:hypothetical protein